MGTVPPRILPPLRQWEQPLAEDVYFNDATNKPIYTNWQQLMSLRTEGNGVVRDGFVYDGYGGRFSVEGMKPIYQIGKAEPIAYVDNEGYVWRVEDEPRPGQYEDAAVDYGEC